MISVVARRRLWVLPVSRKVSVHLWKSVRDKIPNNPLPFFLSQNYTEEQKSQRRTETLSQPISQNLSAIVGCWVLIVRCWWIAETLCAICRRSPAFVCSPCSQKGFCSSVKICERQNPQRVSYVLKSVRKKINELPPKNLPLNTNHGARGKKRKLNYRCIVIDITSMASRWKHN